MIHKFLHNLFVSLSITNGLQLITLWTVKKGVMKQILIPNRVI